MPNIKSAKKRVKTAEAARKRNHAVKSQVKRARRTFIEAGESASAQELQDNYKVYCSKLDKAAKKGVIKRNTAIRRKRRAAARLAPSA